MVEQPVCGADDCENSIAEDRVELAEVPVGGTGEWVGTGERDEEFDLEVTEWTGEWATVNVADCAECHKREQALLAELDAMG